MYAECLNETNATAEAKDYLDAVRHRAGLAGTQVTSQSEMRLAIEDERLLELCFEGHRWYDLNRTGRINKVMTAHFNHRVKGLSAPLQANNNGMAVADCNDASGRPLEWRWNDSDGRILFPHPTAAFNRSADGKQNLLVETLTFIFAGVWHCLLTPAIAISVSRHARPTVHHGYMPKALHGHRRAQRRLCQRRAFQMNFNSPCPATLTSTKKLLVLKAEEILLKSSEYFVSLHELCAATGIYGKLMLRRRCSALLS